MKDSNNIQAIFEDDFVDFFQNIGAKKSLTMVRQNVNSVKGYLVLMM